MKMQSKNILALLAAVIGLIGFFFQFFEFADMNYLYSVSGFETAFLFSGTSILVFLAFLLLLAAVVLTILRLDFLSGVAFIATALFILIFRITMPTGGFGIWWSVIFLLAAGVLSAFGDRIPLPTISLARPQQSAPSQSAGAAPQYQPTEYQQPQYDPSLYQDAQNQAESQVAVFYCTNCGTRMDSTMNFCPGCGTRYQL